MLQFDLFSRLYNSRPGLHIIALPRPGNCTYCSATKPIVASLRPDLEKLNPPQTQWFVDVNRSIIIFRTKSAMVWGSPIFGHTPENANGLGSSCSGFGNNPKCMASSCLFLAQVAEVVWLELRNDPK